MTLTLKKFREMTKDLPEDTPIYYHAYYKGLCLNTYRPDDIWFFPKGAQQNADIRGVVLNPGDDHDPRSARKTGTKNQS